MNRRRNGRRKPYFGSVRFFRHLILTTIALLIIIPTGLAVYFGMQYKKITRDNYQLGSDIETLKSQIEEFKNRQPAVEPKQESVQVSSDEYGEILVDANSWELILVNDSHPLSPDFTVKLTEIQAGQSVDTRIVKDLKDMLAAAADEGYQLHVYSAFRDMKKQQSLFNDCLKRLQAGGMGYQDAFYGSKARIALPGTSEHQTGLVVDVASKDYFYLDEERGNQEEAVWLAKNSYLYGFIQRYPQHKESVTGIVYEPEHYRYVGKTVAKFLTKNDLVLEEFYDILKNRGAANKTN